MEKTTRRDQRSSIDLWIVRALAIIAMLISGYLAYVSFLAKGPAGCGGSSVVDCDHVLKSRWSSWINLPVALPATAIYAVLLSISYLATKSQRFQDIYRGLGLTVGLCAFWFIGIQLLILKTLCYYCLAVHGCGIMIFVSMAISISKSIRTDTKLPVMSFGISLVAMVVLISGQMFYAPEEFDVQEIVEVDDALKNELSTLDSPPPKPEVQTPADSIDDASDSDILPIANTNHSQHRDDSSTSSVSAGKPIFEPVSKVTPSASERIVTILKGGVTINVNQHPLVGSPTATEIFVKLFDYTCPDCRRLHHQLQRYTDNKSISILVLPVPMNTECNAYVTKTSPKHIQACDYARVALAVWFSDRSKFNAFHEWLMQSKDPPSLTAARQMAQESLGVDNLVAMMQSEEVTNRLQVYTKIYKASKAGVIPKLHVRNRMITGSPKVESKLVKALDSLLAIPN